MAPRTRTVHLGDIVEFRSGGTPPKSEQSYWNGDIPWVSAKDMKSFRLFDSQDHISESGLLAGSRLTPAGSVLLLTRGMTLLNDVPICVVDRPMAYNQDVKALEAKPGLDPAYLPYLLLGRKQDLLSSVDLAGHGTGRLNTDALRSLAVELPPHNEQRRITHILGTLDDKIEMNRRVSKTLEVTAQTLFDSWFIGFEPVRAKSEDRNSALSGPFSSYFPDHFVNSDVGEIPKGWGIEPLGRIVKHLREPVHPQTYPDTKYHHFSIPAFDAGQTPRVESGDTIKSQKSRVPPGVVLLSKLNPEIERVWLVDVQVGDRAVCSTEFMVLVPQHPYGKAFVYCLARSATFRQHLQSLVTGTSKSHQRAGVDSVLSLPTIQPPAGLVQTFERAAAPLLERVLVARRESHTLSALRDTLLPKLISGELRIPDAERIVSEAT